MVAPSKDTFDERLDRFPEGWRPEPGDKLTGTVVSVEEAEAGYGAYPLVGVLTTEGKDVAVHGFHTVLKRELARQRPEPGDRIGIKYFGRDEEKGYERYRILVEKAEPAPTAEVDWDTIGRVAEEELRGEEGPVEVPADALAEPEEAGA